jgi:outer membrane protein assembly factor BamD (BamD/ComL family)
VAAIGRLEGLLESYPDYDRQDEVLYTLGLAYRKSRNPEHAGKAHDVFERLRRDYPDSPYLLKLPDTGAANDRDGAANDGDGNDP